MNSDGQRDDVPHRHASIPAEGPAGSDSDSGSGPAALIPPSDRRWREADLHSGRQNFVEKENYEPQFD
jgi:hypothetical protein